MFTMYLEGKWIAYELKERDIETQQISYEILLTRQKGKDFLHRVMTGNEKRYHFYNTIRKKS